MMYSLSFFILAVSTSLSFSFIPKISCGGKSLTSLKNLNVFKPLKMSETPTESAAAAAAEAEESAADMFASPPVLSTLSESGELEIDFDSLGKLESKLAI